jgi:serine/threonine protein kinase/Tol biopolymer transport system component
VALPPGTRIRTYEIIGLLGSGGMGEVYRARDLTLNRDVAIKVLPPSFAGDAERLARFSREAQVLASLNHPNIAHVHGFEELARGEDGERGAGALVMELVEGPTLADRVVSGPLPLDEAIAVARQIAGALDAAHAQGIVHRDLKPANIKVRDDGTVKVLDFGLAKLAFPDASGSGSALANSPTLAAPSQLGMIIGTAAYMAPEQAKGRPVDKRADIWAFGAVIFEMLVGRPLFEGDTTSEVLASVLRDEPRWDALPADTPAALRRVLARCVERDPKRRLHDIADVVPDLDEAERGAPVVVSSAGPRAPHPWLFAAAGLAVGAAAMAALSFVTGSRWPATQREVRHLSVLGPGGHPIIPESANGAISPDGTSIAFVAGNASSSSLWVRRLDNSAARQLPGTKGALQPFWSADSNRIAFFAEGKLKTIHVDGDAMTTICDAPDPRGGTWSASGEIVFAPSNAGGLMKVPGEGGDPQPVTTPDSARGETAHRFPYFLPDGRHFLFVALPGHDGHLDVIAGSLDGKERQVITTADGGVTYAPPGYLIYMRQNGIAAQAFDAGRLTVSGQPLTLGALPATFPTQWSGAAAVSASADGTLVYYDQGARNTRFVWFDAATGKQAGGVEAPEGAYSQLSIAPNGRYAATVRVESAGRSDIWLLDLQRGGLSPFTHGPGQNAGPTWSADSTQIAFTNDSRGGQPQIFVKSIGGGSERQISNDALGFKSTGPWTKDGSAILFTALDPKTAQDIWILPLQGDHTPKPYIRTPANETTPTVSPDGRYVSYMSDETGQQELYIQSYPVPGESYRVTTGGASFGGWLPDGRVAYGTAPNNEAYVVSVIPGPPIKTTPPQLFGVLPQDVLAGDLTPDLKRMLVIIPAERNTQLSLSVVLNWEGMLKKKAD